MKTLGSLLLEKRLQKGISLSRAAKNLSIKKEILTSLENSQWQDLPEPTFVKGLIKNYTNYLGLDPNFTLALFRREYDEAKYPQKESPLKQPRRLMFTPNRIIKTGFVLLILIFLGYLALQYFSILSTPKLELLSPQDDTTTNVPIVKVSGTTEKGATVSISGELVGVDLQGNFTQDVKLQEGKNTIEVVASKKLSPKSKIVRTIRLSR